MPRVGETKAPLRPYWETKDGGIRLYAGDAGRVLPRLQAKSVHTIVTSPPYWGLRDYDGGPDELGREKTPDEYVLRLGNRLMEAGRVIRNDGTLWLNLGDASDDDGNLLGLPWRIAMYLRARGWLLRSDVIWHKPSPMPESVKNRCTRAHEYLFQFAKTTRYYYDHVAVAEPAEGGGVANKRDVWTLPTQGYPGAHFATFPERLVETCLLASTSEKGCCPKCGTPWTREVIGVPVLRDRPNDYVKRTGEEGTGNSCPNSVAGTNYVTTGWGTGCQCGLCSSLLAPSVVLDPFAGSGTTCYVASKLGRASVGIDLSEKYLRDQAVPRLEGCLLTVGKAEQLPGREAKALSWLTEGAT